MFSFLCYWHTHNSQDKQTHTQKHKHTQHFFIQVKNTCTLFQKKKAVSKKQCVYNETFLSIVRFYMCFKCENMCANVCVERCFTYSDTHTHTDTWDSFNFVNCIPISPFTIGKKCIDLYTTYTCISPM